MVNVNRAAIVRLHRKDKEKAMFVSTINVMAFGMVLAFGIGYGIQLDRAARRIKELQEANVDQQRQIDDLKRELEEMKKC